MTKKIPHTFALIFYVIIFAAILTWIIPGGEFDREIITINNSKKHSKANNRYIIRFGLFTTFVEVQISWFETMVSLLILPV